MKEYTDYDLINALLTMAAGHAKLSQTPVIDNLCYIAARRLTYLTGGALIPMNKTDIAISEDFYSYINANNPIDTTE